MLRRRLLAMILSLAAVLPVAACEQQPLVIEEFQRFFVGPQQVDCVGAAPQKCLQVKHRLEDEWTVFSDPIEGFNYEPGFIYELIVAVRAAPRPVPADGSAYLYRLVQLVTKTPAP